MLVEFSLILVAMLTLFYAIIVYSIVFVTQQSVAYAAETGADAIVAVDTSQGPAVTLFDSRADSVARTRVNQVLGFLPGAASVCLGSIDGGGNCSGQCTVVGVNRQCLVEVNYSFQNWGFLVTGLFPLPTNIRGVGLVNTQAPSS